MITDNQGMIAGRYSVLLGILLCAANGADARDDVPCLTCAPTPSIAQASVTEQELRIEIRTQLDFSRATVSRRGGKISVSPQNGSRAVDGDVVDLGGMALAGNAIIRGTPGRLVRVDLPPTVRMSNVRGGTLIIRNLRTNLPPTPRLDGAGQLEFAFGGDLEISGDAYGNYRGRIPITAEYE